MTGTAIRGSKVSFGEFGLKALGPGYLTARQIEAARIAISRHVKRGGQVWIRIFPTSLLRRSPLKLEWEKAKALLRAGWPLSGRAEFFTK